MDLQSSVKLGRTLDAQRAINLTFGGQSKLDGHDGVATAAVRNHGVR
jgi:hypothetical protein